LEQKKGYIIVLILLVAVLGVRMFMNQGDTEQAAEATDHIKEIHIAMLKAEEAYSWFTGFGEINMDAREHYFDNGSVWYGIVEHEDISTMDELETYLSRLFDDTTCNMLPSSGRSHTNIFQFIATVAIPESILLISSSQSQSL
jgi:hypothetical protein